MNEERFVSPDSAVNEEPLDRSTRPLAMADYIGQAGVKAQMDIFINAARNRGEPLDHTLIFGPPGLGKTTLANIIANEFLFILRERNQIILKFIYRNRSM